MYRIVIYGHAIPTDRFMGKGSGTLVDMTYYTDEPVTVAEVLGRIEQDNFFMIPLRDENGTVIAHKCDIEEINVGIDRVYQ